MKWFKENSVLIAMMAIVCITLYSCGERQVASHGTATLTIMVPENDSLYREQMVRYAQVGGEDPLPTVQFIQKEIQVAAPVDTVPASAHAAAEAIYPPSSSAGGPRVDSVVYFRIQDSTAYILLGMNVEPWAGVSAALAIVRPVVEKTMLQYPQIRKVVWDSVR